ncbi:MAG: DoxX family protein [Pyrinomonadaceae bacterium]
MEFLVRISQLVIALGLLNVWLLRTKKATPWRGGEAQNMRQEFAAYGLPPWFMGVIGFLKVTLAILLIVGLWIPSFTRPTAMGITLLMFGALGMHMKVSDPLKKSVPALALFLLSLFVAIFGSG